MTGYHRDLAIGLRVLRAAENWQDAGLWRRAMILLLGRAEKVDHLGRCFTIRTYDGETYLTAAREGRR